MKVKKLIKNVLTFLLNDVLKWAFGNYLNYQINELTYWMETILSIVIIKLLQGWFVIIWLDCGFAEPNRTTLDWFVDWLIGSSSSNLIIELVGGLGWIGTLCGYVKVD